MTRIRGRGLTAIRVYDTVIHVEEVITIRVPKGTRRQLERMAKARHLTVSQLVRRAIDIERMLATFDEARASLIPIARRKGIFSDEDVFKQIS